MVAPGRRRRRLYWTLAVLVVAALGGTAAGIAIYRATRPAVHVTGETLAEITSSLDRGLPDDAPDPKFTEVAAEAGLGEFRTFAGDRTSQLAEDMGPGAAWGDYDADGDDDLFLVSAGGPLGAPESARAPSELYQNRGDGTFMRVEDFPETRILGMGAAWGDFDGNGTLDLAVSGYGTLRLFRNQGGRFVRDLAFADRDGFWSGVAWADFDRDGDLDLYVCGYVQYAEDDSKTRAASQQYGQAVPYTLNPASYRPERNLLFRNRGGGTFDEVAEKLGVHNPEGRSLSGLWHDFDDDGWIDLYVANDISDNVLYMNRKGRFEDISHPAWVADYRGAMGLAAGDWNRDGDDDLFISHWIAQENALYDSLLADYRRSPPAKAPDGASLPPVRFVDVADARGLGQIALQFVGWGSEFADFDGDGWLDLAVANGSTFETDEKPPRLKPQASFLFWNRRGESFYDVAPLHPSWAAERVSRGLAVSDYDNDGDVDVLIVDRDAGVRLLRNDMQTGHWLELRLAGRPVEGTRAMARVGDVELRRSATSASYLSQSSRVLHFGLGAATKVDELRVWWPGGASDTFRDLAADARWEIAKGDPVPRRVEAASRLDRASLVAFWEKQRAAMSALKVGNDIPRAIALFREALAIDPGHEDSLYYLASCLATQGDYDGALGSLAELARVNPQSQRAYKRIGTIRALTAESPADLAAAEEALEKAQALNPEATGVLLVLAEVSLMRGDHAKARQRLEWVCRMNPNAAGALYFLGYLARKRGDTDVARELLARAAKARGPEWKPKGSVAEGDVQARMHTDATPLSAYYEKWDGTPDFARAFDGLEAYLAGAPRR